MQTLRFLSVLCLLSLFTFSCRKNDTPEETGYNYKMEPISVSEITNGHQYTFGSIDFANTSNVSLQIRTARDTADCSIWTVYLVKANGESHYVPSTNSSTTDHYYFHHFFSDYTKTMSLVISRSSGAPEAYSSILVKRYNWR